MVADGKVYMITAVHVDDVVVAGANETRRNFHTALVNNFPTKNLGEMPWYTGCALNRDWES